MTLRFCECAFCWATLKFLTNMIPCEHCGHKDAELRNSDMNLCDGYHQENVLQCMRNLLEKENLEVQEFELEKDEEEPTMTVADTRIYDGYEGDSEEQEEQESTCHRNTDESLSAIVKHKHDSDGSRTKCKKTLKNGVRCLTCTKEFHWRCAGVSLESVKESVKQENKWECLFCRCVDKNCLLCKDRLKEINSLKRCITDLEKNLQSINADLAKGTLRCTELEDQVKIERQLRKKIERDLEERQSNSSSSGSRSDSRSDSQYDSCSSDKNIDVCSKISNITTSLPLKCGLEQQKDHLLRRRKRLGTS